MSASEPTEADFYDGMTPEDIKACFMDRLLWGCAFAQTVNGVKRRLEPKDWPEGIRPNVEEMERIWGGKL